MSDRERLQTAARTSKDRDGDDRISALMDCELEGRDADTEIARLKTDGELRTAGTSFT